MKIAIITVKLVHEADDVPNDTIEREIAEDIEDYPRLPYMEKVEKVTVLSNPKKGIPLRRIVKELCWTCLKRH